MSLGSAANYVYDADGNRYSASNLGTTTSYVVDTSLPYASVVEEYNNGTLAARYDYGDDLVRDGPCTDGGAFRLAGSAHSGGAQLL